MVPLIVGHGIKNAQSYHGSVDMATKRQQKRVKKRPSTGGCVRAMWRRCMEAIVVKFIDECEMHVASFEAEAVEVLQM